MFINYLQDLKTKHNDHEDVKYHECDEIDSLKVSSEALHFIRQSGVSVTEFAEKIARYQRAYVSLALNHPVPMENCRSVFTIEIYIICSIKQFIQSLIIQFIYATYSITEMNQSEMCTEE